MTATSASRQDHKVVRVELAVLLLPLLRAREGRRISRGSRGAGRRKVQDATARRGVAWRGSLAAWRGQPLPLFCDVSPDEIPSLSGDRCVWEIFRKAGA